MSADETVGFYNLEVIEFFFLTIVCSTNLTPIDKFLLVVHYVKYSIFIDNGGLTRSASMPIQPTKN